MKQFCLALFFMAMTFNHLAFGQDADLLSRLDYKVNKMQKELKLTEDQSEKVRAIVKVYLVKREEILQQSSGGGIADHHAVKSTLAALKENEYQKLGKVLTDDQMKAWVDKENMMAALNPDSGGSSSYDDSDAAFNGAGASMKF